MKRIIRLGVVLGFIGSVVVLLQQRGIIPKVKVNGRWEVIRTGRHAANSHPNGDGNSQS